MLNDICVYIPAWFGAIASVMTGLIAYECSLPMVVGMSDGGNDHEKENKAFGSIIETIPIVSLVYDKFITPILSFILKCITFIFGSDLGLSNKSTVPKIYETKNIVDLSSPAVEIGLIAAGIMAVVPAHMMRSVGGGYDNESIANTAMTMTFYCWCRTLRGGKDFCGWSTLFWALLTGIAYLYVSVAHCVIYFVLLWYTTCN